MKTQSSYFILVGRRYLRWPDKWLKKSSREHHGIVARQPLDDCRLPTPHQAMQVVANIRASKEVDAKFKKSLTIQHIQVTEYPAGLP
jgi:hypothetical protein